MNGEGFAYFHWHAMEWVPTGGISFSARYCSGCYHHWARMQQRRTT